MGTTFTFEVSLCPKRGLQRLFLFLITANDGLSALVVVTDSLQGYINVALAERRHYQQQMANSTYIIYGLMKHIVMMILLQMQQCPYERSHMTPSTQRQCTSRDIYASSDGTILMLLKLNLHINPIIIAIKHRSWSFTAELIITSSIDYHIIHPTLLYNVCMYV